MSDILQDGGARTTFETGAVREVIEGRGRCDLLPLDVIGEMFGAEEIKFIGNFIRTQEVLHLYCAMDFYIERYYDSMAEAILDVSIQFEAGIKKYSERNWEKGVPLHQYLDSAVRHWLKHEAGKTDEPHHRAFLWNLMCAIWTFKHKPEMNDLPDPIENDTEPEKDNTTIKNPPPNPWYPAYPNYPVYPNYPYPQLPTEPYYERGIRTPVQPYWTITTTSNLNTHTGNEDISKKYCSNCQYSDFFNGELFCMGQKGAPKVGLDGHCSDWKSKM